VADASSERERMLRGRVSSFLVLVGVAVLSALAVIVVAWDRDPSDGATSSIGTLPAGPRQGQAAPSSEDSGVSPQNASILARGTLARRIVLFGDTVTARADVVLDRRRFDPDSVRVSATFTPWEIVGTPERVRRDTGSLTHVRTTYVLRCLNSLCLFFGQAGQIEFPPGRVSVAERRDPPSGDVRRLRFDWPVLTTYSRYGSGSFEGRGRVATAPWRADLVGLPVPTWRASPGLILALLLVGGALLAIAGGSLLYLARPQREPEPIPEPEAPPPPRLSPLAQALALLEDAARTNGAEERRRSLELVAEALDEFGDDDLARAARTLAWSEGVPEVEATAGLATRVRTTLVEELAADEEDEEEASNGRVV
jgi:hypothetical protein